MTTWPPRTSTPPTVSSCAQMSAPSGGYNSDPAARAGGILAACFFVIMRNLEVLDTGVSSTRWFLRHWPYHYQTEPLYSLGRLS